MAQGFNLFQAVDVVRAELGQEEDRGQKKMIVLPHQMKLLRKLSQTGINPDDLEPYERREMLEGVHSLHGVALALLAVLLTPILWAPWGGVAYCACLPLILVVVWLLALTPREYAKILKEEQLEEDMLVSERNSTRGRRRNVAGSRSKSRNSPLGDPTRMSSHMPEPSHESSHTPGASRVSSHLPDP